MFKEDSQIWQKRKAEKALKTAKKLEKQRQKFGKRYIKINNKTYALR